jgi:trans-2,3-dihydro-3-hydroxyanthranilate isomerase
VRFTGEGLYGEMTQRDPEFGVELDPREVARLIGLEIDDLDPSLPPQIVSTGTAFAIVALRSAEALARLRVSQPEATAWLRACGGRWFFVLALTSGQQDGHAPRYCARMQFYGGEDPATGSAAGMRHQLPGPARRRCARRAHPCAPGRRDRPPQRSLPDSAFPKWV